MNDTDISQAETTLQRELHEELNHLLISRYR